MVEDGASVGYGGYFSQFEGWTVSLFKNCFCESLCDGGGCDSCSCVEGGMNTGIASSINRRRNVFFYCGACCTNANGSKCTCRLCSEQGCEKDSGANL